ncbi:cupin domain-containing protein [Nocardioides sp.]|uniref:cupin domain-containing protein n=1 Tax=Nocardioides sp. TaxID=35761 RepID=UPI0037838C5E
MERTLKVVPTGGRTTSRQGLEQFEGVSAQSVGATGLCAHLLEIPPGARAKAHRHAGHETAIYVIEGETEVWFGEDLTSHAVAVAGDFVYIPPGVPHVPVNTSADRWARAVVARTDPNEQESVELLPHLDDLPHLTGGS